MNGRAGAILAAALLVLPAMQRGVFAQRSSREPDVVVFVAPFGNRPGDPPSITVDYYGRLSRANVKQDLQRLVNASHWLLSEPELAYRTLEKGLSAGAEAHGIGQSTEVRVTARSARFARDGGLWLQPFVEAFHRCPTVELMYWAAAQKDSMPLREYNSPSVSVRLLQAGGPYRYLIENHQPSAAVPSVPSAQAPEPTSSGHLQSNHRGGSHQAGDGAARSLLPVAGVALAAGILVFIGIRLWSRRA